MAIASPTPQSTPTATSTTVQLPGGGAIHICINIYGGAPAAIGSQGTVARDSEINPGEYGYRWWKIMDGISGNTNVVGSFAVVSANAATPFFGLSPGQDHWSFITPDYLATAPAFRMVPALGEPAQFTAWRRQAEGVFKVPGDPLPIGVPGVSLFRASKGKLPQPVEAWLHYNHNQGTLTWLAGPAMVNPDGYLKVGPDDELRWEKTVEPPNFQVALQLGGALT